MTILRGGLADRDKSDKPAPMYDAFYQLRTDPFGLAPEPEFHFEHPGYVAARARLQQGLALAEGFLLLTGPPGVGKTLLADELLARCPPHQVRIAHLSTAALAGDELLRLAALRFGIRGEHLSRSALVHQLERLGLQHRRAGRRLLLVVDDAHELSTDALTALHLLAELHQDGEFLVQILLVGQDPLAALLERPEAAQCRRRVVACCRLDPLDPFHAAAYLRHRLRHAGWNGDPVLDGDAIVLLQRFSAGCPRYLNIAASRLLAQGAARGLHVLDARLVAQTLLDLHRSGIGPGWPDGARDPAPLLRRTAAGMPWRAALEPGEREFLEGGNATIRRSGGLWHRTVRRVGRRARMLGIATLALLASVHTYGVLSPQPHPPAVELSGGVPLALPPPLTVPLDALPGPALPSLPEELVVAGIFGSAVLVPPAPHPFEERIDALLARAEAALAADRLTTPSRDNAYAHLRQVLALDPDHPAAHRTLERIARRYGVLAKARIRDGEYTRAYHLVRRGLMVRPDDPGLRALEADLDTLVAWERARNPSPTPPRPVPRRQPTAAEHPLEGDTAEPPAGILERLRNWLERSRATPRRTD